MQIRWLGLFHKKGGCLENILLFLLISIYLPDNSPFRVANKINDVFYFGAGRHFCFNLCESIRSVESALINDAVGIVDGHVLEQPRSADTQTIGIKAFNDALVTDDRVEKVILPLRDGLTIIRKK